MTIEEFKRAIEDNTLSMLLVIAECADETAEFVFHQYMHEYISRNDLSFEFVDSISNKAQINLFRTAETNLKVYFTKNLTEVSIPRSNQLWVRCKSVSKEISKEFAQYIVKIPKLEEWQIKDYVYTLCDGVKQSELDYLLQVYGKNIYRIDNEIAKLTSFQNIGQIYPKIKDQLFNEVSEYQIFDLVNTLVRYDIMALTNILKQIDGIDVDVFGLLTLLKTNFRRVIDIQLSRNPSAQSIGVSDKQFWAIKKYSCGIYTRTQLFEIYTFLTACDYYIKSGYISTDMMLNYIIVKIISVKERCV